MFLFPQTVVSFTGSLRK